MISHQKFKILTHLQKLPKNVGYLGKLMVDTGFEKLPKVQKNHPIWSHWTVNPISIKERQNKFLEPLLQIILAMFTFDRF